MHAGALSGASILGDEVDPTTRSLLVEATLGYDQTMRGRAEGELDGQSLSAFEVLGAGTVEHDIRLKCIVLHFRIDLQHRHGPVLAIQVDVTLGADLDFADVELIDLHPDFELVQQVDLTNALPGRYVLADLGVDGRQPPGYRGANLEAADDLLDEAQAGVELVDGMLRLHQFLRAQIVLLPDALGEQRPLVLQVFELVARRLIGINGIGGKGALHHLVLTFERLLQIEDLVVEIEQRVLQDERGLIAAEDGRALIVEADERLDLRVDRVLAQ